MAKKEKMGMYKFFRGALGWIYRWYYNPTIIGKENIPKEGPIIVVGNHVHIMDQCNVIISTKRCLHYMAKKEYFDGKFEPFFRSAGCIPVDRSKKDEHATKEALEILDNGWALGLFPEGTRNALKEERAHELYDKYLKNKYSFEEFYDMTKDEKTSQINYLEELYKNKTITKKEFVDHIIMAGSYLKILAVDDRISYKDYCDHVFLPFKYGAVSMAKKKKAKLVPFVVKGNYRFRGKTLVVKIGKPIDYMDDLEEANKKLREAMIELYRK